MKSGPQAPARASYDVVIVGGAIMGSSAAWFLAANPDFDGRVLVVERDPTYEFCSTMRSNSCIRQQFSTELNVKISQFAARYITRLREEIGSEDWVPALSIRAFGYLYLAGTEAGAAVLRENAAVQRGAGAATRLLTPPEIAAAWPFYDLDGIVLGSINPVDEGYWEGIAVFDTWRKAARKRGVEFIANEVVGLTPDATGTRLASVTLQSGEVIACGHVINAAGPRAARVARMAGLDLPVEPRKRYTWIFKAEKPLDRDLPLTIDPSGVHVREHGGGTYLAGTYGVPDPAVAHDDFTMDLSLWQEHVWPTLATRIPAFEAIRVQSEWAGHYAYNTFDQNAIVGPHPEVRNFLFMNGFSGHGLQQSPAMGRGIAEWLVYGAYRTLDLSPMHVDRISANRPIIERAII